MLKENPFLDKDAISNHFEKLLKQYFDESFDYYCTCDEYYQRAVENFEAESYIKNWCKAYHFQVASWEGNG